MISKKLFQILFYITMCFIILQDSAILVGKQLLYIAPFFIVFTIGLYGILCSTKFLTLTINLYKKTPIKFMIFFVVYLLSTSFLHGDIYTSLIITLKIILIFCLTVLPSILFAAVFIPRIISYAKILKIFIFSSFFILIYGIVDYIYQLIFIKQFPLSYIFCTKKFIGVFIHDSQWINGMLQRASSIFFEPSFFATFIFLFLPLAYILCKSKIQVLKNQKIDFCIKISLLILFWVCLFCTKSPIYTVFCLVYILIFFRKEILKLLLKFLLPALIFSSIIIFSFLAYLQELPENTVLSRINNVVLSMGNMESLISVEDSLATRILSTVNTYQAFTKVPVIGCGYGNTSNIMYRQYRVTKTPISQEIFDNLYFRDNVGHSPNIFWGMLLQTGIIGTTLLYLFFIKTIYLANKIKKSFIYKDRLLLEILIFVAINYIIISFYWSIETYPMMWFIFGILNSYILTYKLQVKKLKQIQGVYNE